MKYLEEMPPRYPINGTLELTLRCNLKCKMCMFRHSDDENTQLLNNELTVEQWKDIGCQLRNAGTLNLLITGGEPFLRKDFCEIYGNIYRLGFIITLYTNATLVNEQILRTLEQYPPHRIGITLYGASNETYNTLCGCANGFDKALAGARALSKLPSALEFRMTVVHDNLNDADALYKLIKNEFDLPITYTNTVFQSVRGGCMPVSECRLTPEQNLNMITQRVASRVRELLPPERKNSIEVRMVDTCEECHTNSLRYTLLGCSGGMDSYTITYDGKLLGCQMLDCFKTDIMASGFDNAWKEWPYTVRLPRYNEECSACPHLDLCQVCPGVRMAETGNLQGKPQYICELTKLLASKKGEILI